MNRGRAYITPWVTVLVIGHFVIAIAHGLAHQGAQVPLSGPSRLFVFAVILAGPLVGLVLTKSAEKLGSWIIAITMAAAFVFGLVNHFVVAGSDRVDHITRQSRPLFVTTAVLLASSEVLGAGLAIRLARERITGS